MRIKVTAEHIRLGEPGSARHCPIALAIREATPGLHAPYIAVIGRRALVESSDYILPAEAHAFVVAFDSESLVEPFEFDLLPNTPENAGGMPW
jgi:hypothetical protein